jgi:membrane protease YdiL (CAAX protease family)
LLFLALAIAAWFVLRQGSIVFPGDRLGAHLGRVLCSMVAVATLIAGSVALLRRDCLPPDRLGLRPTLAHARYFLVGVVGAIALICLLAAAFHAFVNFHFEPGRRTFPEVLLEAHTYFWGNFVEELLFRGYAFIALARALGTQRALWILAPAFGLFHLEGLEGMELAKMIATTGAMHFVFAFAYLGARSLWAAVGLHAAANLFLHSITGLSGQRAALEPILETPLSPAYDPTFWVFFGVAAAVAVGLAHLPEVRAGARWIEGSRCTARLQRVTHVSR